MKPMIAKKGSFPVELKAGERYVFCNCGQSRNQPFCDRQSHKGTGITPMAFTVEKDGQYWLCGCKHSGQKPFCDGTHKSL